MRVLRDKSAGFTLLEVVIALGILAMSLTVLLESQASSVNSASRSRFNRCLVTGAVQNGRY